MYFGNLTRHVARACAVIAVAAALGGCSMMPDWLGGDSDTTPVADTTTPPPDQTAQTPDASGQYPDLADTPNRPTPPSTPDDQKQVAQSLGAARTSQNYSADQLRAGTETAAPPPPAEAPQEDVAEVDTGSHAAPPPDSSSPPSSAPSADSSTPPPASGDSTAAAPAPAPTTAVASAAAPAMSGPPSGPPAVPASPVPGAQSIAMSDTQLGFQPSKAPPLDASVAQFVPQPIMSRYRQTASIGGAAAMSSGPAVPAVGAAQPYRGPAIGGPESMSGAVVANFDALQGGAQPAMYEPSGMPATASIHFTHDTTILSAEAKAQVQAAAQAYSAQGGAGFIRVVGHASSRTANMSVSRHLQWDFEHSQARANSVARALIADGVPASKVLISAVGDDNQPDADEGRRADIFFQS